MPSNLYATEDIHFIEDKLMKPQYNLLNNLNLNLERSEILNPEFLLLARSLPFFYLFPSVFPFLPHKPFKEHLPKYLFHLESLFLHPFFFIHIFPICPNMCTPIWNPECSEEKGEIKGYHFTLAHVQLPSMSLMIIF